MPKDIIIDFEGKQEEAIELRFKIRDNDSIEIELEDSSNLTLKPIVFRVLKLKNKKTMDGQPIYLVNSQIFVSATDISKGVAENE